MLKKIGIAFGIATLLAIGGFICFLIGMYNAPEPSQRNEQDHLQYLCDLSRKEPWKPEIKTSCDFMQEFWAIDYKCEDIRGCYTVVNSGQNNNQR